VRLARPLLLSALFGCDRAGEPVDTAQRSGPIVYEYGDCEAAVTREPLAWYALSGLGYLDLPEPTGVYLLEDPASWGSLLPFLTPEEAGVDFDTQVAVVAYLNTSACDYPSTGLSQAVTDGQHAYVEFMFHHPDHTCDWWVPVGMGVALDRPDSLSVCLEVWYN